MQELINSLDRKPLHKKGSWFFLRVGVWYGEIVSTSLGEILMLENLLCGCQRAVFQPYDLYSLPLGKVVRTLVGLGNTYFSHLLNLEMVETRNVFAHSFLCYLYLTC